MAIQDSNTNSYCSLGHNCNTSCRQCLKRTLEYWGHDAEVYDKFALRETNRLRSKVHRDRWYKGDPEQADKRRLVKYGITAKEYAARLKAQEYVCAICREPETRAIKGTLISLAVDHDHETGAIRGLLCSRCNTHLWQLERLGLPWMLRAHRYLAFGPHE